jgi:SP family arabinose:H+ symporter-like MFS transporter
MSRDLIFITLAAAFGGVIIGIDTSLIHESYPYFKDYFELSNSGEVLTYALTMAGCILGSWFSGNFAENIGRRDTLKIAAIVFILSSLGSAFSTHYTAFLIFRVVAGIGIGAVATITPMYLAEVSPTHLRGKILLFFPMAIPVGMLLGWILNVLLLDSDANTWRWMFIFMLVPVGLFLFLLFPTVRSPRWTMRRGYDRETSFVLRLLNPSADIDLMMAEIKDSFPLKSHKSRSRDHISVDMVWNVMVPLVSLALFLPLTGISFVESIIHPYSGTGTDGLLSASARNIITLLVQISALFVAMNLIENKGRLALLRFGFMSSGILLILMAVVHFLSLGNTLVTFVLAQIFFFCLYMATNSVIWAYIPEALPNQFRAKGIAVIVSIYYAAHLGIYLLSPILSNAIGPGLLFLVYAMTSFTGFYYLRGKLIIETKQKSIEDLDKEIRLKYDQKIQG